MREASGTVWLYVGAIPRAVKHYGYTFWGGYLLGFLLSTGLILLLAWVAIQ